MSINLSAIEAAARGATAGPWEVKREKMALTEAGEKALEEAPYKEWAYATNVQTSWVHGQLKDRVPIAAVWRTVSDYFVSRERHVSMDPGDAAFIALANPATILALCARLRAAERVVCCGATVCKVWPRDNRLSEPGTSIGDLREAMEEYERVKGEMV